MNFIKALLILSAAVGALDSRSSRELESTNSLRGVTRDFQKLTEPTRALEEEIFGVDSMGDLMKKWWFWGNFFFHKVER